MRFIFIIAKMTTGAFLFLFCLSSCDSFVEVSLPKSQLTQTGVFEDYSTASAALTDIYSKMRERGLLTGLNSGLSNQLGNYTDELMAYGTLSNPSLNFYNNALLPNNPTIAEYWNSTYNQIYAANSIIKGSQASTVLSDENKKKLEGEALFIRALLHFYLLNLFGDIPYVTQTDYKLNSVVSRMPTPKVYENIIRDLEDAITFLPVAYNSTERVRPNQFTAKALLARVYLYSGANAEAANEASAVLNQTTVFSLTGTVSQVFLINSKETIWQLKSEVAGQNTHEAEIFVFKSGPPTLTALHDDFVTSFGMNDLRKTNWIKSVTNGSSTWFHANKYREAEFTATSKEYSIIFRLAEQYLIRSEARARQGDLIGAKEDLDVVRHRAGLANTTAVTQEEILAAILQERKWEFFTEHGHRFFDLKRFDKIDAVLSASKPGWESTDRLLPIPQSELSANPNLRPQNPGY